MLTLVCACHVYVAADGGVQEWWSAEHHRGAAPLLSLRQVRYNLSRPRAHPSVLYNY